MTKKLFALMLAALMIVAVMAGCTTSTREIWVSTSDSEDAGVADDGSDADQTDKTGKDQLDSKTTKRKKTTTTKNETKANGTRTRVTKAPEEALTFTPVADAGADYNVQGNVSIAVNTVRPTDYEAMFDVLQRLYPNINFVFDYWTSTYADDGREYLTSRMATGTAANIMWDEAGEIPTYIMNGGWITPITDYVAKDPEAKYIPANLKEDYTYYGELFAVPHQATFETVAFNTKLMNELGIKNSDMPGLEWTLEEYEELLRQGAAGFQAGKCVGIDHVENERDRVSFYRAAEDHGRGYAGNGYNYKTNTMDVKYVQEACKQARTWRTISGVEGWYMREFISDKFGVSDYKNLWGAGKALLEDTLTVYTEKWDDQYPDLQWKQWTMPNVDGNMMLHIDHCFITSNTPKADMDACYQALRFMSFSTNGNLARLTMYEDSQKGKYNLSSHIYYLTTTSKAAIEKFNKLSCTDEVDEYLVANIPNCSRYDTFKLVPGWREAFNEVDGQRNKVLDGEEVSVLNEAVAKVNKVLADYEKSFEQAFNKYYK